MHDPNYNGFSRTPRYSNSFRSTEPSYLDDGRRCTPNYHGSSRYPSSSPNTVPRHLTESSYRPESRPSFSNSNQREYRSNDAYSPNYSRPKLKRDYSRVHSHHSTPKREHLSQENYLKHLENRRIKPELTRTSSDYSNHSYFTSHRAAEEMVYHTKTVVSSPTDPEVDQPKAQGNTVKKINLKEYRERKNYTVAPKHSEDNGRKSSTENSVKEREETKNRSTAASETLSEHVKEFFVGRYSPESTSSNRDTDADKIREEERKGNKSDSWRREESELNRSSIRKEDFYNGSKFSRKSSRKESESTIEDPVILTISSDEDEDGSGKENDDGDVKSHNSIVETVKDTMLVGGGSHEQEKSSSASVKPYDDDDDDPLMGNKLVEDFVLLKCKSVWFGSYQVRQQTRIKLTKGCFTVVVPTVKNSINKSGDPVTLVMKHEGICGVIANLEGEVPVIFLYIKPSMAAYIRNKLCMVPGGPNLDPASADECVKRITIILESFDPELKFSIREFWTNIEVKSGKIVNFFKDISPERANEILLSITPNEDQYSSHSTTKLRTKTLFVYPPPPHKGGITITTDDYYCLEEEQFLNDVILDFYIAWLMLSQVSERDRERTHVFSTFFYKRLTSKSKTARRTSPSVEGLDWNPARKRHVRVQSWTKNVDIFSKDFILVPINERSHWYLAVICFPGLDGPVRISDGNSVLLTDESVRKSPTRQKSVEMPLLEDSDWSDRDEAEGDEEDLDDEGMEPVVKKLKTDQDLGKEACSNLQLKPQTKEASDNEPIKQPCILIFDSMSGSSKHRIVATLREYLTEEYRVKKNKVKQFTKETMKGACPKVPQQNNFSDCGLFTLQFAQSFFEHPLKDFRFPIRTLSDWFNQDVVARKRRYIASLIEQLLDEHKPNHGISLPSLHFKSSEKKSLLTSKSSSLEKLSRESSHEKLDVKSSLEKFGKKSSLEKVEEDKVSSQEEKLSKSSSIEKLGEKSSSVEPKNRPFSLEKGCEKGEAKTTDEQRKGTWLPLSDSPLPSSSSTSNYHPSSGAIPEAKKIKITVYDSSDSTSRPKTPLPFNDVPSPPLVISDDDSGHHSDAEDLKDYLNKGFTEDIDSSESSFSSSEKETSLSLTSSAEKESFLVSSDSAFTKIDKSQNGVVPNSEYEGTEKSSSLSLRNLKPCENECSEKGSVKSGFHSISGYPKCNNNDNNNSNTQEKYQLNTNSDITKR